MFYVSNCKENIAWGKSSSVAWRQKPVLNRAIYRKTVGYMPGTAQTKSEP